MKKLVCILVSLLLFCSVAFATDIDLSGMSFEELAALRDQAQLAMWNAEEWQEVTVPQGTYTVGVEIPAGTWIIKCADVSRDSSLMDSCGFEYGYKEGDRILHYSIDGGDDFYVYNPENKRYSSGKITEVKVVLKEGMAVRINTAYAPAVFTPYTGAQSFSFK